MKPSHVVFILLINVKMPTTVGILTITSRINIYPANVKMSTIVGILTIMSRILSGFEYEKRNITSEPGFLTTRPLFTL